MANILKSIAIYGNKRLKRAMNRYKITVEYDGGPYVGWQRQDNGLGVQQVVEQAIEKFCGEFVTVFCAGRTDAGVHAIAQVAHFDLADDHDEGTVRDAINYHLTRGGQPVAVMAAEKVDAEFNARFDANERQYLYRILNRRPRPALEKGRVWWVPGHLDEVAMNDAAKVLLGKHDFTSFRASFCQAKSAVKTLDELSVSRLGDEVHLKVRARSFLHHQVRNMAGSLKMVGTGKWSKDDLKSALEAKDRSRGGQTAPAEGLYLVRVGY